MTTYLRDDAPEDDAGTALVLGCFVVALLSLLLWAGIIWLCWWLVDRPPIFWIRVGALALLIVGSTLIFAALIHIDHTLAPSPDSSRGLRPSAAPVPPGPSRADGLTVPPPVVGRRGPSRGQP